MTLRIDCETNRSTGKDDALIFTFSGDVVQVIASARARDERAISVYPTRNDLIRLRRALGEHLKATQKVKK